jgi:hypothetical protein
VLLSMINRLGAAHPSEVEHMRSLMWVPIIHSPEDLGGLRESIEDTYVERRGRAEWDAYVKNVGMLWKGVRLMIDGLKLDWPRVRLYQDGLPVCDHELAIVRELAQTGSDNHQLLADLIDRGATLTGTESPQLLIEELELNRRLLGVGATKPKQQPTNDFFQLQRQARHLLEKRDRFIATRISATLAAGEEGLIFLGMLHSLAGRLPRDVRLSELRP